MDNQLIFEKVLTMLIWTGLIAKLILQNCLTWLSKSPIDTFPFFSEENFIDPSASDNLSEKK